MLAYQARHMSLTPVPGARGGGMYGKLDRRCPLQGAHLVCLC